MRGEDKRTSSERQEPAIGTARRRFLKQLSGLGVYLAPVVVAISIDELPAQFPSPPTPP